MCDKVHSDSQQGGLPQGVRAVVEVVGTRTRDPVIHLSWEPGGLGFEGRHGGSRAVLGRSAADLVVAWEGSQKRLQDKMPSARDAETLRG